MVGQMLILAQADAGQPILTTRPIALNDIAGDTARSMRSLAEAKGLALTTDITPNLWVDGDPDRLREVLVTLLDNAIKYTSVIETKARLQSGPGAGAGAAITLRAARDGRKAILTVSDTGPGIPPSDLAHIFERFYRADKARSRDEGGTGLGLAIAREIVEAHNGTIRIDSTPGRGTTVTIELRLLNREPAADPPPRPAHPEESKE